LSLAFARQIFYDVMAEGQTGAKNKNSLHPDQGTKAVLLKTPWYHPNCKG
jgi:hypothetical protein